MSFLIIFEILSGNKKRNTSSPFPLPFIVKKVIYKFASLIISSKELGEM